MYVAIRTQSQLVPDRFVWAFKKQISWNFPHTTTIWPQMSRMLQTGRQQLLWTALLSRKVHSITTGFTNVPNKLSAELQKVFWRLKLILCRFLTLFSWQCVFSLLCSKECSYHHPLSKQKSAMCCEMYMEVGISDLFLFIPQKRGKYPLKLVNKLSFEDVS